MLQQRQGGRTGSRGKQLGELRWEQGTRKRRQGGNRGSGGRERHFSNDMVDGRETVGNSFGREGATRKRLQGGQAGKAWEIASAELRISVNGQVGK